MTQNATTSHARSADVKTQSQRQDTHASKHCTLLFNVKAGDLAKRSIFPTALNSGSPIFIAFGVVCNAAEFAGLIGPQSHGPVTSMSFNHNRYVGGPTLGVAALLRQGMRKHDQMRPN
jgi:hypothetical protein